MTVAAVILAAGGGTRFDGGRPGAKLLAERQGVALVSWAVAPALEAGLDEVIVVDGAVALGDVVGDRVTVVHNERWQEGQASSLRAGLRRCSEQGHASAVIGLGDMPGLTASAWGRVAAAPSGPIVFATYDGRRGHPVRLDAAVWPLLVTSGDEGARGLARRRPDLVSEIACVGDPADIDTQEDLRTWS